MLNGMGIYFLVYVCRDWFVRRRKAGLDTGNVKTREQYQRDPLISTIILKASNFLKTKQEISNLVPNCTLYE